MFVLPRMLGAEDSKGVDVIILGGPGPGDGDRPQSYDEDTFHENHSKYGGRARSPIAAAKAKLIGLITLKVRLKIYLGFERIASGLDPIGF